MKVWAAANKVDDDDGGENNWLIMTPYTKWLKTHPLMFFTFDFVFQVVINTWLGSYYNE